jgi:hypothetical protein
VFKIFFVDVVTNMARAAGQLSIPASIYVDDIGGTGAKAKRVTIEMVKFQAWCENLGCAAFKRQAQGSPRNLISYSSDE